MGRHFNNGITGKRRYLWRDDKKMYSTSRISSPYYLRMIVKNAPGVLSSISGVFAENNISIRSLIQKDETKEIAEIVLLIDSSRNGLVKKSLKQIEALDCVRKVASAIRVVEE